MYNNIGAAEVRYNKTYYEEMYKDIEKQIESTSDTDWRKKAYFELLQNIKETEELEKTLESIDPVAGERLFKLAKAYNMEVDDKKDDNK